MDRRSFLVKAVPVMVVPSVAVADLKRELQKEAPQLKELGIKRIHLVSSEALSQNELDDLRVEVENALSCKEEHVAIVTNYFVNWQTVELYDPPVAIPVQ